MLRMRVLDRSSHDGGSAPGLLLCWVRDQPTSHVNEVVGDDPQSYPSPHAIGSVVATTRQPMPPLDHADPAFTSRAPLLAPLASGVTQKRPCRVTSKPAMLEAQDRSYDWGADSLGWHGQCLERNETTAGNCAGAAGMVATAD